MDHFRSKMEDEGTRKRKRFSKNKKKYWKKHADVNDVEEFLEDQRLQQRTGGIVAEKTDAEIFFVDSVAKEDAPVPAKRRRKEKKELKCHSALLPNPHIKPIKVTRNIKKDKLQKNTRPAKITKKTKEQIANRKSALKRHLEKQNEEEFPDASFDLWTGTGTKRVSPEDEGATPNEHYLRIMKITRRKAPKTFGKSPSVVSAIEVSHPGTSYNPDYDDHQDLLQKALSTEERKLKKEKKITRALDDMFPSAQNAPTEVSMRNELAEGLFNESDSDSEDDENLNDVSALSVNPPVRREDKKTETARKKEAKQRIEKEKAEEARAERIRKNEIFRLKSTKKEIKQLVLKQQERQTKKEQLAEQNKAKPKRLGKNRFEEPDLEIKLSDELEGSLRLLKPEGHLMEDRFKSLQKRNIIEPRGRAKKTRKYKRKRFIRKSDREDA